MEAAAKIIEQQQRRGRWLNPKVSFYRDEVIGTAMDPSPVYAEDYVRCAGKILLEYLFHFLRSPVPEIRTVGPPACEGVIAFVKEGEYNSVVPWRPHVYSHRRKVVLDAFHQLGAPSAPYSHRLFLSFDLEAGFIWGGILLFGGDLWCLRLTREYDGPGLTVLYQRSVLRGQVPVWLHRESRVAIPPREICEHQWQWEDHQAAIDHWDSFYRETLTFVEERDRSSLLDKDIIPGLESLGRHFTSLDVLDFITTRLARFFSHNSEAWRSEFARIREAHSRGLTVRTWSHIALAADSEEGPELRRTIVEWYMTLFRQCREYIGPPGVIRHFQPAE